MTTVRTQVVPIEAGELVYDEAGTGPAVILSHGGLVDRHLWDGLFERLAEEFYVVRYDLRGHGQSTTRPGAFRVYEDLRALMDALRLPTAHLVGLSMGGELSIDFALEYPSRVDRLVLVGSALSGYVPSDTAERTRIQTLHRAVAAAYEQGELERAIDLLHATWTVGMGRTARALGPGVLDAARAMTRRNLDRPLRETEFEELGLEPPAVGRLAGLSSPTLVVVGDRDVPYIRAIADLLATQVRGARRVVVPATAHHLPLEVPDAFWTMVRAFLLEGGPTGRSAATGS